MSPCESRRSLSLLLAPLALGALAPWAAWLAAGRLECWMMAVATLAMGMIYLACVHRLGDLELKLRRALGRRYEPPPPEVVLAVCMGLAASFVIPSLSCGALSEVVGLPRVAGRGQRLCAGRNGVGRRPRQPGAMGFLARNTPGVPVGRRGAHDRVPGWRAGRVRLGLADRRAADLCRAPVHGSRPRQRTLVRRGRG